MAIYRIKRFSSEIKIKRPDIRFKNGYSHSESSSNISSYDSEDPKNNYEINHEESHGSHEEPREETSGIEFDEDGNPIIIDEDSDDDQKDYSEMSDSEFEEKYNDIKKNYKRSLGHLGLGALEGTVAYKGLKNTIKGGNLKNKKLDLALGGIVGAAGAAHLYQSAKNAKEGYNKAHDPRYYKKFDKVLKKEDREDDRRLARLEKAEKAYKKAKKDYYGN